MALPQAIHPDILPRIDPEYVVFHNEHIAPLPAAHTLPWDPAIRNHPAVPGGAKVIQVGGVRDIELKHCRIRVFTPTEAPPQGGYPVFIYLHGGGWTLGGIDTQNAFVARQCQEHSCVALCVDYRLAPENPYPAAVEDAVEVLEWVHNSGPFELNANVQRIAVGGASSGGNLAAVVALKAAELTPPIPLIFQLLVVPVIDNTASPTSGQYASWVECKDTVWLSEGRMMWFRGYYLPNKEDWAKWDNSPIYAPEDLIAAAPPAWIGVCELDILRDEGIAYGNKLRQAGVPVEIQLYERAPHQIMSMDGERDYLSSVKVEPLSFQWGNCVMVSAHFRNLAISDADVCRSHCSTRKSLQEDRCMNKIQEASQSRGIGERGGGIFGAAMYNYTMREGQAISHSASMCDYKSQEKKYSPKQK